MKSLSHSGIIVPKYEPKGFHVLFKGNRIDLTPDQEEMAIAWARKLGTEYAEDKTFRKNFFEDFSRALGVKGSPMTLTLPRLRGGSTGKGKPRRGCQRRRRKPLPLRGGRTRGQQGEVRGGYHRRAEGRPWNYMAEPSGIFMGRGKHPLRGKWKRGARRKTLSLTSRRTLRGRRATGSR
jgi:DNA topoisomerase-1